MTKQEIQELYTQTGGEFNSSPVVLSEKLNKIKALIFDWDGVWHSGRKSGDISSFSEVDSMGLNMLRFGYFLKDQAIPKTIIITGENNVTAFDFAEREHLDAVFFKAKDKGKALDFMLTEFGFTEEEILFAFDDILDLGMAARCGVKYLINRAGSQLFHHILRKKDYFDYRTNADGGNHGVREVCELSLGLIGQFEAAVDHRTSFSEKYQQYWESRNSQTTNFYTKDVKGFTQVNRP